MIATTTNSRTRRHVFSARTRRNHNLEEQAQTLYKSWFVDFEPFKDGKFVESELGMIPKGWSVGTMGCLLEIKYGKDHKKLSDGLIPVYGSGGFMRYVDQSIYMGESVLIPRKGSLNNVMYVNEAFWTVDTMFYSIQVIPHTVKYCYHILSSLDLSMMNAGSAVPSMTTDILNSIKVLIPNECVLNSFDSMLSSLYLRMQNNDTENQKLVSARNSLLPKLMSGELNINELDC